MKTLLCALVLAVVASSQAIELNVTLTSSVDLIDTVFAYKATAPGLSDQNGAPLGELSAGTHSADAIIKGDLSQHESYRYSLLAIT